MTPADAASTPEEASLYESLETVNAGLEHFVTQSRFQNFRMVGYINNIKFTTEQSLYSTVLEVVVMVALGVFQVYYLKKVLDYKRMI